MLVFKFVMYVLINICKMIMLVSVDRTLSIKIYMLKTDVDELLSYKSDTRFLPALLKRKIIFETNKIYLI